MYGLRTTRLTLTKLQSHLSVFLGYDVKLKERTANTLIEHFNHFMASIQDARVTGNDGALGFSSLSFMKEDGSCHPFVAMYLGPVFGYKKTTQKGKPPAGHEDRSVTDYQIYTSQPLKRASEKLLSKLIDRKDAAAAPAAAQAARAAAAAQMLHIVGALNGLSQLPLLPQQNMTLQAPPPPLLAPPPPLPMMTLLHTDNNMPDMTSLAETRTYDDVMPLTATSPIGSGYAAFRSLGPSMFPSDSSLQGQLDPTSLITGGAQKQSLDPHQGAPDNATATLEDFATGACCDMDFNPNDTEHQYHGLQPIPLSDGV